MTYKFPLPRTKKAIARQRFARKESEFGPECSVGQMSFGGD
jgi:hypothetical protein